MTPLVLLGLLKSARKNKSSLDLKIQRYSSPLLINYTLTALSLDSVVSDALSAATQLVSQVVEVAQ